MHSGPIKCAFALSFISLASVCRADLTPEQATIFGNFPSVRQNCEDSGYEGPACDEMAAMSARFEAAGICYEVEQDPWDCREAATQPKEQATSGGKVFVSGEWVHAYAGMGQYEGFYKTSDGGADIYYGCAGFYSSLDFRIPGLHVSPGKAQILVDGRVVAEAAAEYASMTNVTTSSFNVKSDYGDKRKAAHNRLIDAMAKGREVIWSLPNGEQFAFSLKGSKDIKSCHSY